MSKAYNIFIWKKAPFLRLLLPVIVGVIAEFYFNFNIVLICTAATTLIGGYVFIMLLPLVYRYRLRVITGCIITAFIMVGGACLTWNKDVRNHKNWFGNRYDTSAYFIATIQEPLAEKNKSYKAIATINSIIKNNSVYNSQGKIILYFAKEDALLPLKYGSSVIIKKPLQKITNSGNPAAFNYAQYCALQQIFYQCYLKKNDWVLLPGENTFPVKKIIFNTKEFVINVLNKYIAGNAESSLAKALLVGYKVDLDKDLVQAYSNVGVVHLIAISGLHLGLIYALLVWIIGKIPLIKNSKFTKLVIILFCLWFFSFLTGASASVLRSAVMFSFIAIGISFNKRAPVYNSLAASAFILICFNPFIIWDVGFQLSYLAVTGIVVSQKLIYNWFTVKNWFIKRIWLIVSVSLSAQIFTLPLCIYYFHQVPLLFLISNIIAIPLATFTLWGCLILIAVSSVEIVAIYFGKLITVLIWTLNHSVLFINSLPFSLWDGISISLPETFLMYLSVICFLYWLVKKNMGAFRLALYFTALIAIIFAIQQFRFSNQKKIIVYNVPSHNAIDFIKGKTYQFVGDSDLATNGLLQNFNLKPGRISLHVYKNQSKEDALFHENNFYKFYDKKLLIIDSAINFKPRDERIFVDYIVLSKNAKLYIPKLAQVFSCSYYIFDASNPMWKIEKWKKDCEELHLRFHSVPEQGAFITDF